jgi:putative DNA primase/helicase
MTEVYDFQKQATKAALRAVNAFEFLKFEFPPLEPMLSPWLNTQGLTMIHAPRGVGKTLVGIGIAVAVASGGTFLRWTAPKARGALYIDGEMPGVVLQKRLACAINSSETEPTAPLKIITPDLQEGGIPDLAADEGQAAIQEHLEDVSLVIVDNISCLCRSGRENEGESWLPLQTWALRLRSRGLSVLFVHHDGKDGRQRGTSRREDVLDTVIHLKRPGDYRPEEGARFEVHFEKSRMIYGDDVKPFDARLITNPDATQAWTMKDLEESITERVADLLNEGVPQHEIAEMLGVVKGTVSKCKTKAQTLGLLKENGPVWNKRDRRSSGYK